MKNNNVLSGPMSHPKTRLSNIELLRIISVFLILVFHIGSLIIGMPTAEEMQQSLSPSITRIFFANLSVICVDVFILISGWFGMHLSVKGVVKLLFQVFFIYGLVYAIYIVCGYDSINLTGLANVFMADKNTWFIKAYLGLMCLSPALNALVEHGSEKQLRYVLISFYSYQIVYGWITGGAYFLNWGFSVTSFAGLYLLARYTRKYLITSEKSYRVFSLAHWINNNRSWGGYFLMFLTIVLIDTIMYCVLYKLPFSEHLQGRIVCYTNPLVILEALTLLLTFNSLNIKSNKFINWVAASSYTAYLLHASHRMSWYKALVGCVYTSYEGLVCIFMLFAVLMGIYVAAVLLDQLRIIIWKPIEKALPDAKI